MPLNLATAYEAIAATIPDEEALVCGDVRRSWREYDARASRLAGALETLDLAPAAMVGLCLHNGNEYSEAQYAAMKCRAAPFNVNYRYVADELRSLLDDADAQVVFFDPEGTERMDSIRRELPRVRLWVQVGGAAPDWAAAYEDLLAAHEPADPRARSSDDLWILYTGGTTGQPKGVMWPHGSLIETMDRTFRSLRLAVPQTPEDVVRCVHDLRERNKVTRQLAASPLMHGTASLSGLTTHLQGGCVVTQPGRRYDADAMLACIQDEAITYLTIVGDVFARPMVAALEQAEARGEPYDLSSLFLIMSSGVMWSAPVKEAILDRADVKLLDALGSSESIGMASQVGGRGDDPTTAKFRLGPNSAVFTDDGRPVEPGSGELGQLAVSGAIPLGYYGDPEKTSATFKTIDGRRWSIPGDWARVEVDGSITLLGRGSVCINTGGEKVYPEEVEEALKVHPAVVDVSVVGIPDERWGEAVTALVQVAPGAAESDDEIVTDARSRIASYKLPKHLVRVDQLHRSPSGKADYRWARQAAIDALGD